MLGDGLKKKIMLFMNLSYIFFCRNLAKVNDLNDFILFIYYSKRSRVAYNKNTQEVKRKREKATRPKRLHIMNHNYFDSHIKY